MVEPVEAQSVVPFTILSSRHASEMTVDTLSGNVVVIWENVEVVAEVVIVANWVAVGVVAHSAIVNVDKI